MLGFYVVEGIFMGLPSIFKFIASQACVGICLPVLLNKGGPIYYTFGLAISLHRTSLFVSAVALIFS